MEEERKLDLREKPLIVQLHWNTDNREGRFVLRNDQDIVLEVTGLLNLSDVALIDPVDMFSLSL